MKAQAVSEQHGFVRYQTIQNNFSINNRRFEDALSDICRRENIGLLPYSPLAGGVLTGKYNESKLPENSRFTRYLEMGQPRQKEIADRFLNEKSLATTAALRPIADKEGVTVARAAAIVGLEHEPATRAQHLLEAHERLPREEPEDENDRDDDPLDDPLED